MSKNILEYSIVIGADRETVWKTMLERATYEKWTSAFCEGSTYEGSWEEGERIRFVGPGGDGGMVAVIAENRPNEFLSIQHLGEIKNGVEDTESEEVRKWAPSFENYSFSDVDGGTKVDVRMESLPGFEEFMNTAWPKALATLKSVCESAGAQTAHR